MSPKQYGIDANGAKQGSLVPLSKIKYADINMGFACLLNEELRAMKREQRKCQETGEVYKCDELTLEASAELQLMIDYATANENGKPISKPKPFNVSIDTCPGCQMKAKVYRAKLCRHCYAEKLGWSSIKKK